MQKALRYLFVAACIASLLVPVKPAQAAENGLRGSLFLGEQFIYADGIANSWSNWSWDVAVNASTSAPKFSGAYSLSARYTGGWAGLYLSHPGLSTSGQRYLRFFIHGGSSGGQKINVFVHTAAGQGPAVAVPAPSANRWSEVRIPLSDLGAAERIITGVVWQSASASAQPAFYLDDVQLFDGSHPDGPTVSTGTLMPRALRPDGVETILLRAQVSDPQGAGDIEAVTVNAQALGLGVAALYDDGRSSDGEAGDGWYAAALTPAPGIAAGEITLVVSARDRAGHQSTWQAVTLVVLNAPGGNIPAALPQHTGWGTNAWTGAGENWQPNSGVPWDYLYQYITYGWEGWGDRFVSRFVNHAWNNGYVPIVTVYIMYGLPTACGEGGECYANKLKNAGSVEAYLQSLRGALEQAKGSRPVIINIEPDFYGTMQRLAQNDDPSTIAVALNKSGYANNLAGFGRYLVDMIHSAAPNALAAPMASTWATNQDPQNATAADAARMAQRTASFINAMGGAQADLLVVEWSDRDAGSGKSVWWDASDTSLPRANRALWWENALSAAAGKRLLLWQVPAGNMSLDNQEHRYQDNRAEYAFHHARELADAGILGVVFGAGEAAGTQIWTDGGYIAEQGGKAYAPPSAPGGLRVAASAGAGAVLRWNDSAEPDLWSYRLSYQPAAGGTARTVNVSRRTSASLLLPEAGAWRVWLNAVDAMGNTSPPSGAVTVTTTSSPARMFLPSVRR